MTDRVQDDAKALASAAADALFKDPRAAIAFEPDSVIAASAAVSRFGERFAGLDGVIVAALAGAREGAVGLSGDRLQGMAEILQNADDAGASKVTFSLREDSLVVAHDGSPLNLKDVLALATPWLTTKTAEASATGRFGIGLMTLHALSRTLEVYSGHYALRLGDPTIDSVSAPDWLDGLGGQGTTILRIPLNPSSLDEADFESWFGRWDEAALLFCQNVRIVDVYVGQDLRRALQLNWEELPGATFNIQGQDLATRRRRAYGPGGMLWTVHTAEARPPIGLERSNKAIGDTTPIGIALPTHNSEPGYVHAGLPVVDLTYPVRVNAQFDPLTGRQGLAPTDWNRALCAFVADLWVGAALDLFAESPQLAWRIMPGPVASDRSRGQIMTSLEDLLLDRARVEIPGQLTFQVDTDRLPISQLAVEEPALEGVLEDFETARVAGLPGALPHGTRDPSGVWRRVLDDWREAGAALGKRVEVHDALTLLDDPQRAPRANVALAAAAIRGGVGDRLADYPWLVTDDGSHLDPPHESEPWLLVSGPSPLADVIGMARHLDPAYTEDNEDAAVTVRWLESRGSLAKTADAAEVLRRLARVGQSGGRLPSPISDLQLRALRDAMEAITPADRAILAAGIGRAIELDAYRFDGRRRKVRTQSSPANAYLPRAIDREPDAFVVAAGSCEGILWMDPRYADVLRSGLGRAGLGAQRILRLLGAETAPRLAPHPLLEDRYTRESRKGLPASVPLGSAHRKRALADLGASYSLADQHSPDLATVLVDISKEKKPARRRERAAAMLASLGRAWDRLGDSTEVTAAADDYGWQLKGSFRAFWLWQAGTIAWLDSDVGSPSRPLDLRLRTNSTLAVYGTSAPGYLHRDLHGSRREVLLALGVTGEPTTRDLVDRLRELSHTVADNIELASDTGVIYQALAERLAGSASGFGDLMPAMLRHSFAEGAGLVWTNLGWRRPSAVLAGKPVFGDRRAFTPAVPNTARLWTTLQIRSPGVEQCITVLGELARRRRAPDLASQVVMLETFRLLSQLTDAIAVDRNAKRRLTRIPLWTTSGWIAKRPIHAIDDPLLAAGLGSHLPVWQPGGELAQFEGLLDLLGLRRVTRAQTSVLHSELSDLDDDATGLFRAAVGILQEDLARNEPGTETAVEMGWQSLSELVVHVLPDLRVLVSGLGEHGDAVVSVSATVDPSIGILFLDDSESLPRVDGGGSAIASLIAADRRRIAQAWLAACDAARTGRDAQRLRLSAERAADDAARTSSNISARLAEFQQETATAHARGQRGRTPERVRNSPGGDAVQRRELVSTAASAVALRSLIDPAQFKLEDPRGTQSAFKGDASERKQRVRSDAAGLPAPRYDVPSPQGRAAPRAYTALTKESVGLDLVRMVLSSDANEVRDLRAQHGVGADAVDQLDRFFELKVYAGAEPDRIALEESEIKRAMSTPNFFLVVVSGLEGPDAKPKVRVIVDPLRQLEMATASIVIFTGVRSTASVTYTFALVAQDAPSVQDAPSRNSSKP